MTKRGLRFGSVIVGVLLVVTMLGGCGNANGIGSGDKENVIHGENVSESTAAQEDVASENGAAQEENAAPDFTVELNDGSQFTLSDAKGKVVLINICAEMPAFQRLYEEYGDQLQIVAINYAEKKQTVDQFIADNGYTFPFAYDEEAGVMELYPSEGIPYTILIDKSGRVYKTFLGARSAEEQYEVYRSAIEEAMNEEK